MVHMTLPRTLREDEEAFQFVCRGYWLEMLERAGGTPADDPMVRGVVVPQDQAQVENETMVYVRVIGYAIPVMPAEEVMRQQVPLYVGRYYAAENAAPVEPEMPTYTLSELMAHINDVAIAQPFNYDAVVNALVGREVSINVTGPWTPIRETDDDLDRPIRYDFSEGITGEHWGDAMHWHHEEGKEPL
jgi:hypothetical protein